MHFIRNESCRRAVQDTDSYSQVHCRFKGKYIKLMSIISQLLPLQ
jgi:hypothetical protein